MMAVLLESSGARGPRRGGWTMASVSLHAALIGAAVALTMQSPIAKEDPGTVLPIISYVPAPPLDQPSESAGEAPLPGTAPVLPIQIAVPIVPTIDVGRPFTATVEPGDIVERRRGTADLTAPTSPGGLHTAASVDRLAASLPGNGAPPYPGTLRAAGLEGSVVVTFIVDTTGRAEPSSVTIVSATHTLFADAVRQWLERTRYVPAEIAGRRVRQLVQQQVGFSLRR